MTRSVRNSHVRAEWAARFWHASSTRRGQQLDRWRNSDAAITSVTLAVQADGASFWSPTRAFDARAPLDPVIDQARGENRPPTTVYRLRLEAGPHERTTEPAGPNMGTIVDPPATRTFQFGLRPLEIEFRLDEDYRIDPESVATVHDNRWSRPRHGGARVITRRRTQILEIDWKPDWLRRGSHGWGRSRRAMARPLARSRNGVRPSVLVLHSTGGNLIGGSLNTFLSPALPRGPGDNPVRKGIHYIVDLDGHVVKLVHEDLACNHTGRAVWRGTTPLGRHAIGIEHVHLSSEDTFPRTQLDASKDLVGRIVSEYGLRSQLWNVVGHADISCDEDPPLRLHPSRRINCPGLHFPWREYEAAGLAVTHPHSSPTLDRSDAYGGYFVTPSVRALQNGDSDGAPRYGRRSAPTNLGVIAALQRDLKAIGWHRHAPINGVFDDELEVAVKRFQARFMHGSSSAPHHRRGHVDIDTINVLRGVRMVVPAAP